MSLSVANFYKFIGLSGLTELRDRWQAAAERYLLVGTVTIAPEGINAALAGSAVALGQFEAWVRADPDFADVAFKMSQADSPPFRRLEVKIKRWTIRFAENGDPGLEAISAGPRISAAELAQLIATQSAAIVLIDTRNDYETEAGTFSGAVRLPIKNFTEFPQAFCQRFGAERDKAFVFYCTGGIRCEKAVPWAQAQGFANVRQLDGGILTFLAEQGGDGGFEGDCFVFDERRRVDGTLYAAGNAVTLLA